MPPHHGNDAEHMKREGIAPKVTHQGAGNHPGSHGHTMPGPPTPIENPRPGQGPYGQGFGQDPSKLDPRDRIVDRDGVNAGTHYSLHAVFQQYMPFPDEPGEMEEMVGEVLASLESVGVEIRGWYDVSGYRHDADLMFWGLANTPDILQEANHAIMRSDLGAHLQRVWNVMSAHMVSEFTPYHLPACFDGIGPRNYASVYPFNRSFDWYWLQPEKRQDMLKRHGMNGLDFLDVQISTLASFALSDYEWSITLEHDDVARLMGVLRKQREVEARVYTREDTPMFTGKRVELLDWAKNQPAIPFMSDEEYFAE